MSVPLEGGCACGEVRYRLTSGPLFVHCCHCLNCQRQTGSAFVINLLIESDRVELLAGEPKQVDVPRDDGSEQPTCETPSLQPVDARPRRCGSSGLALLLADHRDGPAPGPAEWPRMISSPPPARSPPIRGSA